MNSWPQDRIYRRTASGDDAFSSTDPAIPSDYRRILRVIEGDTHSDVVRGLLRQFPDALLADWLAELEELGLIESGLADPKHDLDFTNPFQSKQLSAKGLTPDDTLRIEKQALTARTALDRSGTFLSPDRLENRPPVAKKAGKIVVLIVEDDPDQAALAQLRVSTAGYAVRVARDCKELLDEIRSRPLPDLLLLDILLPDGNGFDVLANMRRHPKLALLPIVMLTVLAKPEEVRRGLDLGADGYITKPYSKKILTDTIRAVLKHA
jgi:two-component system, OmpR family, alkaline phosphatase synthesis response regulator PhoP